MAPPIHTEYFRSGAAVTRTFTPEGASAVISFIILSAMPNNDKHQWFINNNKLLQIKLKAPNVLQDKTFMNKQEHAKPICIGVSARGRGRGTFSLPTMGSGYVRLANYWVGVRSACQLSGWGWGTFGLPTIGSGYVRLANYISGRGTFGLPTIGSGYVRLANYISGRGTFGLPTVGVRSACQLSGRGTFGLPTVGSGYVRLANYRLASRVVICKQYF